MNLHHLSLFVDIAEAGNISGEFKAFLYSPDTDWSRSLATDHY